MDNPSRPTVEAVGPGGRPPDLPAVGGMRHPPITADIGLITDMMGAGSGPGFGCRCPSITGLGRRPTPITGTSLMTGTSLIIGTNLMTGTSLNRRHPPITGTNLNRGPLSTVGTVGNGSPGDRLSAVDQIRIGMLGDPRASSTPVTRNLVPRWITRASSGPNASPHAH